MLAAAAAAAAASAAGMLLLPLQTALNQSKSKLSRRLAFFDPKLFNSKSQALSDIPLSEGGRICFDLTILGSRNGSRP